DWVKSAFGIAMLALSLHYLRRFLPTPFPPERSSAWLAFGIATIAVALPLGAIHLSFKGSSLLEVLRKTAGVGLATVGFVSLVAYADALPPGAKIIWRDDIATAQADAARRGQPLLVDFGADWCGACTELRSEEHTSELQSREKLVCRLLLEKKKIASRGRPT